MTTRAQAAQHKRDFLTTFAEHGNISTAALASGVDRRTVYKWQESDDQFAAAFREAEIQATEILEAEARRRAVDGVVSTRGIYDRQGKLMATEEETKYSDTLLIFLLKARAPEKYRERVQLQHAGHNGGPLDLAALVLAARGEPSEVSA